MRSLIAIAVLLLVKGLFVLLGVVDHLFSAPEPALDGD